jgi:hypothetical protein
MLVDARPDLDVHLDAIAWDRAAAAAFALA